MHARLRRPAVALITTALAASVLGIAPAAQAADGSISGTVSGAAGNLDNVQVLLYQLDADTGTWEETGDSTFVDPSGAWELTVPTGNYRVGFDDYTDQYAAEYYDDVDTVEAAETVTVPAATPVNADLALAARVGGVVTNARGDLLDNIMVTLYRAVDRGDYVSYERVGFDDTDAEGVYDIGGVPGGDYLIGFEDDSATYATEYYSDQSTLGAAVPVTVEDEQVRTDLDEQLDDASTISGEVTDGDGVAVTDGFVTAFTEVGGQWVEVVDTPIVDGAYSLDRLSADTYRVRLVANLADGQAQEFWQDASTVEAADDIVLAAPGSGATASAQLVYEEPAIKNTAAPTIAGTPQVGSTLTATVGAWTPTPDSYDYQWYSNGTRIPYAWDATYVPTEDVVGTVLRVVVTAYASGLNPVDATSAPTAPVAAAAGATPTPTPTPTPPVVTPPVVTPPVVTPPVVMPPAPVVDVPAGLAAVLEGVDTAGKPQVGKTIKVTGLDALFRAGTSVSYKFQWYAGTTKIKKATKSRLKITRAMKGKKISVKVTAAAASTSKSVKLKVGTVR